MKLISHSIFLKHDLPGHPERAERIKKALKQFKFEEAKDGEAHLLKVHTARYIDRVKNAIKETGRDVAYLDAGETYVVKDTYKAACFAVGAAVQAAEYARQKKPAFALVRPPGHHAHPNWTNGFCIFNNVAIASAYLAEKKEKVLIVDIDIHRGDGTMEFVQSCKELDGKLYYFSINQQGIFPGMTFDEGPVKNVYLPPGTSEDEYIAVLEKELPAVISHFKPTVIAVSAGFDSFSYDSEEYSGHLGCGLSNSRKTIDALKKIIGNHPYFAVLEGGYSPDSVLEGVGAFLGVKVVLPKKAKKSAVKEDKVVNPLKGVLVEPVKVKKTVAGKKKTADAKKSVKGTISKGTPAAGKIVKKTSAKKGRGAAKAKTSKAKNPKKNKPRKK
ncbi:hypothetical protein KY363_02765 [Candidatus Woesearchaeota archaeon]|nr:hypothetical protein [Candidatus Woesearchaeota archaeon]